MAKSRDSGHCGHDLGPHNLLWKLDEIIVGFRIKCREIGKVTGTGLAAILTWRLPSFHHALHHMYDVHNAVDLPITCTCESTTKSRRCLLHQSDVWRELKSFRPSKTCLYGRICVHESYLTEELPAGQDESHQFSYRKANTGEPEILHVT
jgi:hypothetical protein